MWKPKFGAVCAPGAVRFTVWAPDVSVLEVVIESTDATKCRSHGLTQIEKGLFQGTVDAARPGDLYRYRIDGKPPYPDPASRFQPLGVHGSSEIIDPHAFAWSDADWRGCAIEDAIFYEVHVGAFTLEGTLDSARSRLPFLKELGVTAIELMPLADFPGNRNWGYDGAALYAPARCYGRPDDLRRFVDEAHGLGLAVFLDVVYNHFGPDGAYAAAFSSQFFSPRHRSPWGDGINLDDAGSRHVRQFFIDSALHWIHEYHLDGLRLDATHILVDDSPQYFLAELSAAVRDSLTGSPRQALLIAEDTRNTATMLLPAEQGGWQIDGVWSDDFHHQVRRHLTGDSDGYYADFSGSAADIASTAQQGWFYTGQYAQHFGQPRGTDPAAIPPPRFVFCIQNHDQVGNRAFGDRLHHSVDPAVYRAVSVLLLLLPETPLLFMGQEWAASSPFQFFTDHSEDLGRLVSVGRQLEFAKFSSFSDPAIHERIPDPQSPDTFKASKLDWDEITREHHAATLRLYKRLLGLRRNEPALRSRERADFALSAPDEATLLLRRTTGEQTVLALVRTKGEGTIDLSAESGSQQSWYPVLTTEDADFVLDAVPVRILGSPPIVEFRRPGAAVLFNKNFLPG